MSPFSVRTAVLALAGAFSLAAAPAAVAAAPAAPAAAKACGGAISNWVGTGNAVYNGKATTPAGEVSVTLTFRDGKVDVARGGNSTGPLAFRFDAATGSITWGVVGYYYKLDSPVCSGDSVKSADFSLAATGNRAAKVQVTRTS
ncbi:hypothetical protein SAMN05421505_13610 [Sinosporangium album]|uniref:Uncharacterized protein n=1 Tax=Sinosporangium album TaxID=504805 RepID=A0A1G8I9S9_9ACTN|nr:hypothetical protein [Sinosporangium album]SDI15511.1 hypothetical protein SAMN05421505_13610 [Sinosporangium album]